MQGSVQVRETSSEHCISLLARHSSTQSSTSEFHGRMASSSASSAASTPAGEGGYKRKVQMSGRQRGKGGKDGISQVTPYAIW